ncbi:MAG: LytTR family DNA-binding domain-containing protein [Erysipelotrichaceae bacterium]
MIKLKCKPPLRNALIHLPINEEHYQIVICDDSSLIEEDKLNIVINESTVGTIDQLLHFVAPATEKLACFSQRGEENIALQEVFYFEALGSDVFVQLEHRQLQTRQKLYQLEEQFAGMGFVRISKSLIVNLDHVVAVKQIYNGKMLITLANETPLEVNRTFKKAFRLAMERK